MIFQLLIQAVLFSKFVSEIHTIAKKDGIHDLNPNPYTIANKFQ